MVERVVIRDNQKSPIRYISELRNFSNGKEYKFKTGVNVIVGENGSGKTTLLNLIRAYLLVDDVECDKGIYNCNINRLFRSYEGKAMFDGVDVYADYARNTFRLCHKDEKTNDSIMANKHNFGTYIEQNSASTGEAVNIALNSLFGYVFSKDAKLMFEYGKLFGDYPLYGDYVGNHRVMEHDEWTFLMDEPDRNLDILNIEHIKSILDFHKDNTQIIATIHNPLLIYSLFNTECVNFIEMTPDYLNKVVWAVDKLIKNKK